MDHDDEIAANRANWDERVESHLVAYGTDAFVADPTEISGVVRHDLEEMRETYEWQHPISEIIQSLLDAGLRITSFHEGQVVPWMALPNLVPVPHGYALPEGRERLPLTFSVTATR